jgi:hypothetical protein
VIAGTAAENPCPRTCKAKSAEGGSEAEAIQRTKPASPAREAGRVSVVRAVLFVCPAACGTAGVAAPAATVGRLTVENRQKPLGNGRYDSRISANGRYYSEDGNPLGLRAKLLLTCADGSAESIVTEPGDAWQGTDTGPYVSDDIFDGQAYDARKAMDGWAESGFVATGRVGVEEHPFAVEFPESRLVAYAGETARIVPEWSRDPQSVTVYTGIADEDRRANGRGHIVVDASRLVDGPCAAGHEITLSTGETANQFMSDAYYAYSTKQMADMARDTGRTADAQKYAGWLDKIRTAFRDKYLREDPDGQLRVPSSISAGVGLDPNGLDPEDETQTALLWVLKLGFYEDETERQQLVGLLAANIENTAV